MIDRVGIEILEQISSKIFDNVADIDLSSLYPSITMALNISPETTAGKLTMYTPEGTDVTDAFIDHYNSANAIKFSIEYYGLKDIKSMEDLVLSNLTTIEIQEGVVL